MSSKVVAERYVYSFEEIDEPLAVDCTPTQNLHETVSTVDKPLISTPGGPFLESGFWRRQFSPNVSSRQRKFDWAIGVFLPLICFYFDPFIFRTRGGGAYLGKYQIFAYTLGLISIMSMAAWLLWGERLRWLNGWLAGVFLTGSVISLIVGISLIPISLMGLVIGIGVLGFTPLFASIIYLRNAFRAIESGRSALDQRTLFYVVSLSSLVSFVVPYVINNCVGR